MSSALSFDEAHAPPGPLVNMRVLAITLKTSRQTITAWIDRWPDFPIVERGSNGREYKFDASAVLAYLRDKQEKQARGTAERDLALAQLTLPLGDEDLAPSGGPLSVKEQIEAYRLRKMQREEAEASGQLVEAARISELLSTCFIGWNRALHNALRQAGREHNLPDSLTRSLDARLAETQREFVKSMRATLAQAPDDDA